jgi:hypothetical protein
LATNPSQAGTVWTPHELFVGWSALGAHVSDAADAVTLNAQTYTAGPFDVPWDKIRGVLMGEGAATAIDWGKLTQVAQAAVGATLPGGGTQTAAIQATAIAIQQCCIYGGTLRASDATIWALITSAGTTLSAAAVGGLSAASATAVGSLRAPTLPVWTPVIGTADIAAVRVNQP